MKSLSSYMQDKQTNLFKDTGAFFAFSNEQLDRHRKADVDYVNMGNGMVCPKDNAARLNSELRSIYENAILEDIADNGKTAIINRELANHEAHIVCDIADTVDALEDYPITVEEIKSQYAVFFQHCIDNDLF